MFFVISGSLITSIIRKEKESGRFSLVEFYERRARRILPALFVVMAVSFICAWFVLLPADMALFSKNLFGVSVFSSNFLFWRGTGYVIAALRSLEDSYPVVWLSDTLCPHEECKASIGGTLLYWDNGHLSYEGSALVGRLSDLYSQVVSTPAPITITGVVHAARVEGSTQAQDSR